ncbi:alpha/beta hydrolase [Aeromicrobium duanguangcaii]|uniref:Alpha/beta fold hydrolase n=1 Tax=Aeromicrobium duanguangcaii TaxID=2968086 RepID=A0ABY5KH54_9ACTN|nr:alpha/beta fold hydrolase [Aeromicrobium duanguangcaii]MCD9153274.1 alpha/beta fold hydrolase [Aeromicrobium duanguangcaii]UUI69629.1 alpha/beta fold hydrolase [Aeromicrobium duanguangcaii]
MSDSSSHGDAPVRAGAEPFYAPGGRVGILLSHGFTGSPASMAPWGRFLAELGHTVAVPRLPGHGTTWQQMNTTTWRDWYGEVDDALTDLRSQCDWVAVCGLSMGGALALRLAEQRPEDVDALVLVNPAIALKRRDLLAVPLLSRVVPSLAGVGNDIKLAGQDEVAYDRTPLKALASQLQLWRDVRENLDRVTAPLLMFRSVEDHVVDEITAGLVLEGVSSPECELIELRDSYHVATLDHDAQFIMETSAQFIADHAPTP